MINNTPMPSVETTLRALFKAMEKVDVTARVRQSERAGAGLTKVAAKAIVRSGRPSLLDPLCDLLAHAGLEDSLCDTILSVANAGPDEAFLRIVQTLRSQQLLIRPSALRWFNDWTACDWSKSQVQRATSALYKLECCLTSSQARRALMEGEDPEGFYLALLIEARHNKEAAAQRAIETLKTDVRPAHRFAGLRYLRLVEESMTGSARVDAMLDGDIRIAMQAATDLEFYGCGDASELIPAHCQALLPRVQAWPQKLPPLIWPWWAIRPSAALVKRLEKAYRSVTQPLPQESSSGREQPDFDSLARGALQAEASNLMPPLKFWQRELELVCRRSEENFQTEFLRIIAGEIPAESLRDHFFDTETAVIKETLALATDEEAFTMITHLLQHEEEGTIQTGMSLLHSMALAQRGVARCHSLAAKFLQERRMTKRGKIPLLLKAVLEVPTEKSEVWQVLSQVVNPADLTEPDPPDPQAPALSGGPRKSRATNDDGAQFSDHLTSEQGCSHWRNLVRSLRLNNRTHYGYDVVDAHARGYATDSDLAYYLLGQEDPVNRALLVMGPCSRSENRATERILQRCIQVVADYEINHAASIPTIYSNVALKMGTVQGAAFAIRATQALGREGFERTKYISEASRAGVLSRLVRFSEPSATDTLGTFTAEAKNAALTETQLIAMALFAPQWSPSVAQALKLPGVTDMVWWLHAHTSGDAAFEAYGRTSHRSFPISERSRIPLVDFQEGAADVQWFQQAYAAVGERVWKLFLKVAKYASSGAGHMRALVYAEALLGQFSSADLLLRINTKRHQDSVRALGLAKLPTPDQLRATEIRLRYEALQEFRRGARTYGMQRRVSEERAAVLGLENLARNAGYTDPIRMEWELEATAVRQIFKDMEEIALPDVVAAMSITSAGMAVLKFTRAGQALKTVPPVLQKHAKYLALKEHRAALQVRLSRARTALQYFMAQGAAFTGSELSNLMQHPLLAPMLRSLLLFSNHRIGFPSAAGDALVGVDGELSDLRSDQSWRIAHPHDLLPGQTWTRWQQALVASQVVQPFKQVFRELYVPTREEIPLTESCRYEGRMVKSAQALALLAQRGWRYDAEHGASKTIHEHGLTAFLSFQEYFHDPSDSEIITLARVSFLIRALAEGPPIPLAQVPALVFSEIMRDLDLVASVAWAGPNDPQFTPASLEMRKALVRTVTLSLKLTNITFSNHHVHIAGSLGKYRIHLGSTLISTENGITIHLTPAVPNLRTALYLPFADDDPTSAELLSKVLLLAEDHKIGDAKLLAQLRL